MYDSLIGFSYFVEGRALLEQERKPEAEIAFKQIPTWNITNPLLAMAAAENLNALKRAQLAREILTRSDLGLAKHAPYWVLLGKIAFELRDCALLIYGLERAHQLRPDDMAITSDFAAALISARIRAAEAVELARRVFDQFPDRAQTRINYAIALVLNHRPAEARTILNEVKSDTLAEWDASSAAFAWFSVYVEENDIPAARAISAKVSDAYLLPPERAWFRSIVDLPSRPDEPVGSAALGKPANL